MEPFACSRPASGAPRRTQLGLTATSAVPLPQLALTKPLCLPALVNPLCSWGWLVG